MTVLKRFVLRLFISPKYITANVVDRNNRDIVATASTVEHALKYALGRSRNVKAASVVGEVLAMRLKVAGLEEGQGRGIHANVHNNAARNGFQHQNKIWAIVDSLRGYGVKLILDETDDDVSTLGHR